MSKTEFHEVVGIFPPMSEQEFSDLKVDIEKHGVRRPAEVWKGKIIDGRNRWCACEELGVKCPTVEWDGKEEDLLAYVVSLNLHRRQLNAGQRATVAQGLLPFLREQAANRHQEGSVRGGKKAGRGRPTEEESEEPEQQPTAVEEAARIAQTNPKYVLAADRIRQESPALFEAVKSGEVTLAEAKRKIDAPKAEPATPPRMDGRGQPIPGKLLKVFDAVETFRAAQRLLSQAKGLVRELAEGPAGQFLNLQSAEMAMGNAYRDVAFGQPYVVCVYCHAKGSKEECACKGSGYLPKSLYDQAPEEMKRVE